MSIEDLKIKIFQFVSIAEENFDREWFREMDEAGVELTNALDEMERYKLALFGVIRNSKVMPVGLAQGRNMEEINAMALKTMEEVLKMCDFDKMKQFYSEAEEALAKMGGK